MRKSVRIRSYQVSLSTILFAGSFAAIIAVMFLQHGHAQSRSRGHEWSLECHPCPAAAQFVEAPSPSCPSCPEVARASSVSTVLVPRQISLPFVEKHGFDLTDMTIGQAKADASLGHPGYYFFVFHPSKDIYVSKDMVEKSGLWEPELNILFGHVFKTYNTWQSSVVMDVGANLGAFSLYAASLGCKVISFEMQPLISSMLELSRLINRFDRMKIHNVALWDKAGVEISFTPVRGNYGGTHARENQAGEIKSLSRRLDDIVTGETVIFLKIDVENSEEMVLTGFSQSISAGRVRNIVIETRKNQRKLIEWFYQVGFLCIPLKDAIKDLVSITFWEREASVSLIDKWPENDYRDMFCSMDSAKLEGAMYAVAG